MNNDIIKINNSKFQKNNLEKNKESKEILQN